MKKLSNFILSLMIGTLLGCFISCKSEIKTEYVDKVYTEAVIFDITNTGDDGMKLTMLSTTEDAKIYYTTDGMDPTTESNEYTDALFFTENTLIKAFAVKDGLEPSPITITKVIMPEVINLKTSEILSNDYYSIYHYLQNIYGSPYLDNYSLDNTYSKYLTTEDNINTIKSSHKGFTATTILVINKNVYVFYNRNTINYTFIATHDTFFEDGSTSKIVTGLYGATCQRPKAPQVEGLYFNGWKDAENKYVDLTFDSECKTYYATYKEITSTPDYSDTDVGDIILENGFSISFDAYSSATLDSKPVGIIIRKKTSTTPGLMLGIYSISDLAFCENTAEAYKMKITELETLEDGSSAWDILCSKCSDTSNSDLYPMWYYSLNYTTINNIAGVFSDNNWYIPTVTESEYIANSLAIINNSLYLLNCNSYSYIQTVTQNTNNATDFYQFKLSSNECKAVAYSKTELRVQVYVIHQF